MTHTPDDHVHAVAVFLSKCLCINIIKLIFKIDVEENLAIGPLFFNFNIIMVEMLAP